MQIAIVGASSYIAKDLILSYNDEHELFLFCRRPDEMRTFMQTAGLTKFSVHEYHEILTEKGWYLDAVLNFVGAGDPQHVINMGADIFRITEKYDGYALCFLRKPETKYIFISSGAAYGNNFERPVTSTTPAIFPMTPTPSHYYGLAKYQTECAHRLIDRPIVDLRVYSYFSDTQNLSRRFMITDMLRAIKNNDWFKAHKNFMYRDYIGAVDFRQAVDAILVAKPINRAFNCYSSAPIEKEELLELMSSRFGLRVEISNEPLLIATGVKPYYYSIDRDLSKLGYIPTQSSLSSILEGATSILDKN